MKTLLRPAISLFVLLSAVTGALYPLAVTGIVQAAFPQESAGSLIVKNGTSIGSHLIGQNFSDPKYFWGRPSATSPQPYNAAASGGSNLGPLNPALIDSVKGRIKALQTADLGKTPSNTKAIPADLVTTSASGLDPHISPAAADYQIERVARARQIAPSVIQALVGQNTEGRQWGVFGEPRVNVLALNIALDSLRN